MPLRDHVVVRQLPNALSVLRLAAVPVFVALVVAAEGPTLTAGALFVAASATDYLDGVIARRAGVMSQFGKVIDPLADRLLVGAAALLLAIYDDRMPWFGAAAVLARDAFAMATFALAMFGLGFARRKVLPDVTFVGKTGTALIMVGLAALLVVERDTWPLWLFWPGIALSCVASVQYVVRYRWVLRAGGGERPVESRNTASKVGFEGPESDVYSSPVDASPPAGDGGRGDEESSGSPT